MNKSFFNIILSTVITITLLSTLLASQAYAAKINSHDDVSIKIDINKTKNIINNSNNSIAKIYIGGMRNNTSSGRVDIDIKTDYISNSIRNGQNSDSFINIGSVENADIKDAIISVDIRNVENTLRGGSKNNLVTNIAVIKNSIINNSVDIQIRANGKVSNTIQNGTGNSSEISIGSITSDDKSQDYERSATHLTNYSTAAEYTATIVPNIVYMTSPQQNPTAENKNKLVKPTEKKASSQSQNNQYTIEKRQSSISNVGGHNFLVLKDPDGKVISELHGLPVDTRTGKIANKGVSPNHGLRVIEFDHSKNKKSGKIKNKQPSTVLATGNKDDILKRWDTGRKKGDDINQLKLPYPKFGIKLFKRTVNSNSVESTLSTAMGLSSPKLKLPLTIQDYEEAIEYDKEPYQNFLYTPGEGRLIQTQ